MIEYRPNNIAELYKILDTKRVLIHGAGNYLKKFKNSFPKPPVYLSGVKELLSIEYLNPNNLSIGAMCNLGTIVEDARIPRPILEVLKDNDLSASETLGGLLCNPESKPTLITAFYAYNVYLNLSSSNGDRYIPINDFYNGDKNVLKQNEFLRRVMLPLPSLDDFYFVSEKNYSFFIIYKIIDGRVKDLRISISLDAIYRSKYLENLIIGMDYKDLQIRSDELISVFLEEFNLCAKDLTCLGSIDLRLILKTALNKIFIF